MTKPQARYLVEIGMFPILHTALISHLDNPFDNSCDLLDIVRPLCNYLALQPPHLNSYFPDILAMFNEPLRAVVLSFLR